MATAIWLLEVWQFIAGTQNVGPHPCCRPSLTRFSSLYTQYVTLGPALEQQWGMRDLLTIKHTPAYISVVSQDTGALLWQNAASMSVFGEAAAQGRPVGSFKSPPPPCISAILSHSPTLARAPLPTAHLSLPSHHRPTLRVPWSVQL